MHTLSPSNVDGPIQIENHEIEQAFMFMEAYNRATGSPGHLFNFVEMGSSVGGPCEALDQFRGIGMEFPRHS